MLAGAVGLADLRQPDGVRLGREPGQRVDGGARVRDAADLRRADRLAARRRAPARPPLARRRSCRSSGWRSWPADAEGGLSGELGGILLGLVAAATWAFYSVVAGPLMRALLARTGSAPSWASRRSGPLVATAAPQLASRTGAPITRARLGSAVPTARSPRSCSRTSCGSRRSGRPAPNRASLYANLQPFLGAVFAVLVLSETMGSLQIARRRRDRRRHRARTAGRPPVEVVD